MIQSILFYASVLLISAAALAFIWNRFSPALVLSLAAVCTATAHLILTNVA